jgi:hypothetical protein
MTWFEAIPIALAAALWLLAPGLAITYAFGLRGITAWALAPVMTVAVVAATAVVAAKAGVAWSVWLPLVVAAVVAAIVGAGALLLRGRRTVVADRDPRPVTVAALLGAAPAFVLGLIALVLGFGRPDALSQTYDAVFHYNAIALILETHNASSLAINTLGNTELTPEFYPAGWHGLGSLLVSSTGTSIPAATNLLSAACALVVWPLGCLVLARQIFGRSRQALALTGLLSVAFTGFPWMLVGWGVLWPNMLGLVLVPAMLALVVTLAGYAKDDSIGRTRAALMLPIGFVGIALAHPSSLFSLIVLAIVPVAAAVLRRALRLRREGNTPRGVLEVAGFLVVVGAAWLWAATTPILAKPRTTPKAPDGTAPMALGEVLFNSAYQQGALWAMSAIVLAGAIWSLRSGSHRWLIAAHLLTAFLYVIAAAVARPATQIFTGYWYNDPVRLAAMLPVTAIPLATIGMMFLVRKAMEWRDAHARDERPTWRRRLATSPAGKSRTTVLIALSAALVVLSFGLNVPERAAVLQSTYQPKPDWVLVDPAARSFYVRIKDRIPEDSVVAGNPWDGSALVWMLARRRALYPHLQLNTTPEQDYLKAHLNEAATDPKACAAIRHLRVDYLLIGNNTQFWPGADGWGRKSFSGLKDPEGKPGFELVDSDGPLKLYRITACASAPSTAGE